MGVKSDNGHEYRIVPGIFAVAGYFNGVIDALTDDFALKFFISQITMVIMFTIAIYEMAVMDSPRRPILASVLLGVFGVMGYMSFWHAGWLLAWQLARGPWPDTLWLAPNVYVNTKLYSVVMVALFTANIVFTILINVSDRVKNIYMPRRRYCFGDEDA